jgi:hypothetical protein
MAQIRDTDIIRTPEVNLDPRLFIPDGVIDIGVKSSGIDPENPTDTPSATSAEAIEGVEVDDSGTTDDGEVHYDEPSNLPVESGDEEDKLPTPQYIEIVSQTIRIAPDGSSLVDVVINVEDIPGISNYDVRMTKA